MNEKKYLLNMPTDILNDHGLSKTLLTRRETIYLKHIMKNIFVYGTEEELIEKLNTLQFDTLFDYVAFITNKLRAIYKIPRSFNVQCADKLVQEKRYNFFKMIEMYKILKPVIVLDFDKTVTNMIFHSTYKKLIEERFKIIINSANPNEEVIINYLRTHDLPLPRKLYSNKGKQKKIVRLKDIVYKNIHKIYFYIDDEEEYLNYGCLLGMYCYHLDKQGKIKNYTFFKK